MPANIVGAIANEAGLEGKFIGRINIFDDYSTVDLPDGMPNDIYKGLEKVWVAGQPLKISRESNKRSGAKVSRPPIGKADSSNRPPTEKKRKPKAKANAKKRAKPRKAKD